MARKPARTEDAGTLTYQDVLDEAIEETFPASDPIAPAVANAGRAVSTPRNPTDWKLEHAPDAAATRPRARRGSSKGKSEPGADEASAELEAVYRALQRGRGREDVTEANVDALIDLARERGDATLEILLREWRSACGDDPDMPATP